MTPKSALAPETIQVCKRNGASLEDGSSVAIAASRAAARRTGSIEAMAARFHV
jgi:hypothetical protein